MFGWAPELWVAWRQGTGPDLGVGPCLCLPSFTAIPAASCRHLCLLFPSSSLLWLGELFLWLTGMARTHVGIA